MATRKKQSCTLRVRMKPEFLKEIAAYVKAANTGRNHNRLDQSKLTRDAVYDYMQRNPVTVTA